MSSIAAGTTTTTGYVVTSDSTGALVLKTGASATTAVTIDTSQNVTFVGSQTLSAGTANGVLYLNGSKAVTSGSALTFDGSVLATSVSGATALTMTSSGSQAYINLRSVVGGGFEPFIGFGDASASNIAQMIGISGGGLRWTTGGTEQMRLTSTGLGIGTSSPAYKLDVVSNANATNFIRVGNTTAGVSSKAALFSVSDTSSGQFGTVSSTWNADPVINANETYAYGAGGLLLYSGSTSPLRFVTNGAERARITSDGNFLVGTTGNGSPGLGVANSTNISFPESTNNTSLATMFRQAGSGDLVLGSGVRYSSTSNGFASSFNLAWARSAVNVGYGAIKFFTAAEATVAVGTDTTLTERARIDSSGNLLVATTSLEGNAKIVTVSATNGISARTTAAANSYEPIVASRTSTVGKAITLWYDVNVGTQAGFINIDSTSTVSLNNTSDYRVKENIQPLTGSIERVKNLKPVSFNFKADGYFAEGFIAHEFAEVIPQAVHGEKDAVDENGKPVYQAIDQSKIVPLLTAALQEQQALIETLTQRITALEGR
jgi:hypothetical protein